MTHAEDFPDHPLMPIATDHPESPAHISREDMLDLARSYQEHIYSLAYFALLGNSEAAREVCRDVFVRAWEILQSKQDLQQTHVRLMVIATEMIENQYQELQALPVTMTFVYSHADPWIASLLSSCSQMPRHLLFTVLLTDVCGMTFDEVAVCLDDTEEHIIQSLLTARSFLDIDMLQACRLALIETLQLVSVSLKQQEEYEKQRSFDPFRGFDLSMFRVHKGTVSTLAADDDDNAVETEEEEDDDDDDDDHDDDDHDDDDHDDHDDE